jgi:hypothetical protein
MASLVGTNLDQVVAKIGPPNAQEHQDGQTFLVWTSSEFSTTRLPQTAPANGRVEPMGYQMGSARHDCRVFLRFDAQDKVTSYKWIGDTQACGRYAKLAS